MRLLRAAANGDSTKMLKLYWISPAGPNNTKWLCRAADKENPIAQNRVGLLYSHGSEGLPKDMVKAFVWYQQAAANGSRDAHNEMLSIQQAFTADQFARLEELTMNWKPGQCERDLAEASRPGQ